MFFHRRADTTRARCSGIHRYNKGVEGRLVWSSRCGSGGRRTERQLRSPERQLEIFGVKTLPSSALCRSQPRGWGGRGQHIAADSLRTPEGYGFAGQPAVPGILVFGQRVRRHPREPVQRRIDSTRPHRQLPPAICEGLAEHVRLQRCTMLHLVSGDSRRCKA